MGTVTKRGNIYYIRYEGPPHPNGKRNQKKESCRGLNKRQAEELLRRRESEIHTGTYVDTHDITLSAWFATWIKRKTDSRSPTTIEDYQQKFRTHVAPVLGHVTIQKLRPLMIQHLIDDLVHRLASKTVRNVIGCVHSSLSDAVALGMIQWNPADRLILPAKRQRQTVLPQIGDLEKLLGTLEGTPYKIPVMLIVGTAMRRGEVLGLKWSDFEPNSAALTIQRAIVQTKGQVTDKEPKSGRTRVVLLPAYLVEELQQHRADLAQRGIESDWMVVSEKGERMTPKALATGYERARKRVGVTASMHKWRHDQATTLLMAGVPAKVVSERLGHANISITNDLYAHVLPTMQSGAVDILEANWQKAHKNKKGTDDD